MKPKLIIKLTKVFNGRLPGKSTQEKMIVRPKQKFLEKKFLISLPVVGDSNQMNFFNWSSGTHLKVNNMGIPEPVSTKILYPDLILVPLVGFDKNKFRLGYGGGYYDRYIEKVSKIKKFKTVGLSFSFQEIEKLPVNKFDKKLDFIITENKIYS